jgi:hypothetical protein
LIWLRAGQEPPENPKHAIQNKTIIVMNAWNPFKFHMLDALPRGRTFDAECELENILTSLVPLRPDPGGRKLVIHADNAMARTAQKCIAFCAENGPRLDTCRPYSPDLAPSDFFLFGHVKHCLQGMAFGLPK